MWFTLDNTFTKFVVLILTLRAWRGCEAISNANFNAQIRDYAATEHLNLTGVKTLQKQGLGLGRYASFAPEQNVVFKDVPDSVISESSHGRGLLHHDNHGYGFDYEEPHYSYEYKPHDFDHHDHDYHHYEFHDDHHHPPAHHHGYGHHNKHYDHGLASKALLWPIAGIALLGAAAALVTNPVLLQLGVVSGKRRRRQIEDIEHFARDSIKKWSSHEVNDPKTIKVPRKDGPKLVKRVKQLTDTSAYLEKLKTSTKYVDEDRRFIPIPLKMNKT